ncbi:hypothetical protein [Intestinimonas butyriciproducens]|uniref:hypothetical protein n=1 Tax=Intestinimonas butyriciproducens TaxID=1297617 RepID=UPI00195A0AB0|nr:hypothetical protein [Intestinimonas butyriciproducens]MBM6919207.1 hypothetical protein [Intestinimonas butyriciproducens]
MYTKIDQGLWRQMKQKGLSETGRLLYLYLFSCPHRNMLGLYSLPQAYCCADLGMEPQRVEEGFRELEEAGLLAYDQEEEMVLLTDFLRTNPLDNVNVQKKACTIFQDLPQSPLFSLLVDLLRQMEKPYSLLQKAVSARIHKGSGEGYANTEEEKETETEAEKAEAEKAEETEEGAGAEGFAPRRFHPPTLSQVRDYVYERNSPVDPQGFLDFYQAKGWMVGSTPMQDWKAALRNAESWERWQRQERQQGAWETHEKRDLYESGGDLWPF